MRAIRPTDVLAAALLAGVACAAGAADKLYKWTDAEGVTHYTDSPPPASQEFETRVIDVPPAPPPVAEAPPGPADAALAAAEAAAPTEACERLRANLAVLRQPGTVRMDLDGDGTAELLTAEQRAEQVATTEERLALDCQPGGAAAQAPAADGSVPADDQAPAVDPDMSQAPVREEAEGN